MTNDEGEAFRVESEGFAEFFSPLSARHRFLTDLAGIPLPADLEPAARSFRANLEAVSAVASLPFAYRFGALRETYRQRIADRRRAEDPKASDEHLLALTAKEWDERFDKKDFQGAFVKEVFDRLLLDRDMPDLANAFDNLHRQAAVMTWTAAETVAQDVFRATLNGRPDIAVEFLKSAEARELFEIENKKKQVWAALYYNGLDLSACIADLLVEIKKIDNVLDMKKVFGSLFPTASNLRASLDDMNLRVLFFRRNLIVHRGARVDKKYLEDADKYLADTTDGALRENEILKVRPKPDLEDYLHAVGRFGKELLLAAEPLFAAELPVK